MFLKILQNSQENTCIGVSVLMNLRKRLQYTCFSARTPFLQNTSWRLLMHTIGGRKTYYSLQAGKNKVDMIYCYVPIRKVYRKFLDLDFRFWNILAQRKLSVKLVKGIFKCFIIDVGFISCLTSIRLTYQGLIWVLFTSGDRTLPLR